ncbi:MAG: glycerophosphodiester phosphodiesterase [Burkholderiales bacterium]
MVARVRNAVAVGALALALPAAAFDLQGHRGARGLAPENTMAAFERALAIGVTTLETDLAVTGDNVLVLSHDPFLNASLTRAPSGAWLTSRGPTIRSLSLAQLQRYDVGRVNPASDYAKQFPDQKPADGQRVPTLAELFALGAGNDVHFNIETKITPNSGAETPEPGAFAQMAVDAVRASGLAPRTTIQSFDWRTLVEVNRLAPEIATSCLTIESSGMDTVARASGKPSPWHAGLALGDHGGSVPRLVKAAGCANWSSFWRNLTPALVAEAHELGLTVFAWTVNDPADMAQLIDWRVDGIITDYPDRLRTVMQKKKLPLPRPLPPGR